MNKKERQALKRKQHKQRLKEAKVRRRGEVSLERAKPTKVERSRILIVCEGKNTEPSYFSQFKLSNAEVYPVGEGKSTITLVESVEKIIENLNTSFDQVWCVFDKDDFSNHNYDNAIAKAKSLNYQVAYSNQAFEYWFILHFESHNGGAMHRDDYCKRLNKHLEKYDLKYDCNSKFVSENFFEVMLSLTGRIINDQPETLQDLAISRAKNIEEYHVEETPANSESITLVYKLIESLREFI